MSPTRPATPADAGHEPLLGILIPPSPRLPRGALFLVGVPRSACSEPRAIIETTGEVVSDVRRVA